MKEEVKRCIEQAERYLALREHNKNEMIEKLKTKNYSDEVINECLEFLIDSDELNENRYIRAFILSSNKRHPEGKFAVSARLFAKKADKELSKQVIDELYTEDYVDSLLNLAVKKLERKKKTQLNLELQKLGFTSSEIRCFFEKS